MTRDDNHHDEKSDVGELDDIGEREQEDIHSGGDAIDKEPKSLLDTMADPDVDSDPAAEIEEKGEPFEGNHA